MSIAKSIASVKDSEGLKTSSPLQFTMSFLWKRLWETSSAKMRRRMHKKVLLEQFFQKKIKIDFQCLSARRWASTYNAGKTCSIRQTTSIMKLIRSGEEAQLRRLTGSGWRKLVWKAFEVRKPVECDLIKIILKSRIKNLKSRSTIGPSEQYRYVYRRHLKRLH